MLPYIENVSRCARKLLGGRCDRKSRISKEKCGFAGVHKTFSRTHLTLDHCNEAEKVWEEKACFNIRYLNVRRKEAGPDVEI